MNSIITDSEKKATAPETQDLQEKLEEMVATVDTGARNLRAWSGWILASVSLVWSLFQLWIASPFPYMLADIIPLLNSTHNRSAHLAFAIFLAFVAFPALAFTANEGADSGLDLCSGRSFVFTLHCSIFK